MQKQAKKISSLQISKATSVSHESVARDIILLVKRHVKENRKSKFKINRNKSSRSIIDICIDLELFNDLKSTYIGKYDIDFCLISKTPTKNKKVKNEQKKDFKIDSARYLISTLIKGREPKKIDFMLNNDGILDLRLTRDCIYQAAKEINARAVTRMIKNKLHVWLV